LKQTDIFWFIIQIEEPPIKNDKAYPELIRIQFTADSMATTPPDALEIAMLSGGGDRMKGLMRECN
jgi:hypothetical protein